MIIKNWTSKNEITINGNDTMQDAMRLLKEHGMWMLPVMEKGKLVGFVTDRDQKRASASAATTSENHKQLYLFVL